MGSCALQVGDGPCLTLFFTDKPRPSHGSVVRRFGAASSQVKARRQPAGKSTKLGVDRNVGSASVPLALCLALDPLA